MSTCRDIDDTADLPINGDSSSNVYPLYSDDTARMRLAAAARAKRDKRGMHPFAEGIIRFYRARTLLEGDAYDTRATRAWRYLDRLSPHHLPPETLQAFFELTYFVREQEGGGDFDADQFRIRVRSIAEQLDSFVDELNAQLDS